MAFNDRTRLYKITFTCFLFFILTSGISITLSQGILLLTIVFWLYGCFTNKNGFQYNRTGLEGYIVLFIIVSVILALLSPSRIENLLYLKDFWLISAFILASSLIKTKEDLARIFFVFIIVAVIQSVAVYIQYFTKINFLNALKYGLDDPRSKITYGRIVVGFLGGHLTFSGYMMMISFPLFYMIFLKRRDFDQVPGYMIKVPAVMAFISIIMSWARSVILAMPFALAPMLMKSKKKFVVVTGIVFAVIIIIFSTLGPYGDFSGNMYNDSTKIRIQIWKYAFNLFKQNPLMGTGGGNYEKEFKEEVQKSRWPDSQYSSAENRYKRSMRIFNRAKKKLQETSVFLIYSIEKLESAEMAYREAELKYWGIEEFISDEEGRYNSAYEEFLSLDYSYENFKSVISDIEKEYNENHEIFKAVEKNYDSSPKLFLSNFPSMVTHAHNDYLNQLARKGIIGLFAFLYMLYSILKYLFDNLKSANDRFLRLFYKGLFGSLTAFLMASMFQCYYTDDETLVMFWLNIGILAGIVKASGNNSYE